MQKTGPEDSTTSHFSPGMHKLNSPFRERKRYLNSTLSQLPFDLKKLDTSETMHSHEKEDVSEGAKTENTRYFYRV